MISLRLSLEDITAGAYFCLAHQDRTCTLGLEHKIISSWCYFTVAAGAAFLNKCSSFWEHRCKVLFSVHLMLQRDAFHDRLPNEEGTRKSCLPTLDLRSYNMLEFYSLFTHRVAISTCLFQDFTVIRLMFFMPGAICRIRRIPVTCHPDVGVDFHNRLNRSILLQIRTLMAKTSPRIIGGTKAQHISFLMEYPIS